MVLGRLSSHKLVLVRLALVAEGVLLLGHAISHEWVHAACLELIHLLHLHNLLLAQKGLLLCDCHLLHKFLLRVERIWCESTGKGSFLYLRFYGCLLGLDIVEIKRIKSLLLGLFLLRS
jgi:hypothetical protein